MNGFRFPTSQGELIRTARAGATQAAFAKLLGVDRSCLSRYESEALGAPTSVLNHCLKVVSQQAAMDTEPDTELQRALRHARRTVTALEAVERVDVQEMTATLRRVEVEPGAGALSSTRAQKAQRRPTRRTPRGPT